MRTVGLLPTRPVVSARRVKLRQETKIRSQNGDGCASGSTRELRVDGGDCDDCSCEEGVNRIFLPLEYVPLQLNLRFEGSSLCRDLHASTKPSGVQQGEGLEPLDTRTSDSEDPSGPCTNDPRIRIAFKFANTPTKSSAWGRLFVRESTHTPGPTQRSERVTQYVLPPVERKLTRRIEWPHDESSETSNGADSASPSAVWRRRSKQSAPLNDAEASPRVGETYQNMVEGDLGSFEKVMEFESGLYRGFTEGSSNGAKATPQPSPDVVKGDSKTKEVDEGAEYKNSRELRENGNFCCDMTLV
jgi:hypothetical protein